MESKDAVPTYRPLGCHAQRPSLSPWPSSFRSSFPAASRGGKSGSEACVSGGCWGGRWRRRARKEVGGGVGRLALRLRFVSLHHGSADVPGTRPKAPGGQSRFKLRSSGFMVFFAAGWRPAPRRCCHLGFVSAAWRGAPSAVQSLASLSHAAVRIAAASSPWLPACGCHATPCAGEQTQPRDG